MIFDRFAHPWVLGLLAAVPVLLVLAWLRSGRGRLYFPTAGLDLPRVTTLRSRLLRLPLALRMAALALLLIAAARPQDALGLVRTSTEGVALQIVLDRSSSMAEPIELGGQQVTRLAAVKRVAAEFVAGNGDDLAGRAGDMIGVIAFGTYADTICPLVREHGALLELIEGLDFVPRREGGTAIGEAVALAAPGSEKQSRRSPAALATTRAPSPTSRSRARRSSC